MNTQSIEKHFGQMGAQIAIRRPTPPSGRAAMWWNPPSDYSLDIEPLREGDRFVLSVPQTIENQVEFAVLQSKPNQRHLLLMGRRDQHSDIDRFLCGHDGHGWFVAAVPGAVSTVADARESLQASWAIGQGLRAGLGAGRRPAKRPVAFLD